MLKFILKKFLDLIPTLVGISILSFVLIRLIPGDPIMLKLGERGADPAVYAEMKRQMGLDLPIYEQYFIFVKNALQGDLGRSIVSNISVTEEFFSRFPATIELGMTALFIAILIGVPLGILAAVKRNSFYDYFLMGGSLVGYSMPIFWWGLILILFFSVTLGITPVSGRIGIMFDVEVVTGFMLIDTLLPVNLRNEGIGPFLSVLSHLILPSIAMGTIPLAVMARMTRSSMLEVLGEDYIRTAKAKGLPIRKIIGVHALRNALIPIVTVIGLMFGSIITGAILTETIFSWPGIGKWLVTSINARDYNVIQGGILFIATMIVLINLVVDLIYAIVNPKMR
ncbi:dipeptide ABC transporter permease DppB [Halobacteriovorax marinus]|mgnify:CR=1 FL=1|uniref:Dipeptide ABC transporter permease DppB n=1 Tax=Halobacteriovorax marinus TaxID=97084 RepID=A0A1Y5FDK7_9BACT|nr:dipeptide ABC transporter permease DppB [Halobacteriovorax marinus]